MDQDVKKLWVDALRSGEYKQTKGRLRIGDCFCVMGVLCDLKDKIDGKDRWRFMCNRDVSTYDGKAAGATKEVYAWAGLDYQPPFIVFDGVSTEIDNLNDRGVSFERLAYLIESQL